MAIKLFTVAEMVAAERAADERAADAAGVTYAAMMETAGRGVAEAIIARQAVAGRTVLVLVGPGNNGGDGLVAARYLAEAGADVAVYLFTERDPASDDNLARVQEMGLFVLTASFDQRYRVLRTRLNITDIVIDALLGTGVSRPIEGELAHLMRQAAAGIAERRRFVAAGDQSRLASPGRVRVDRQSTGVGGERPLAWVVAVDCPSGLNCDTGELDRLAIPADLTVTFAGPKRGHFRFPGAAACGELVLVDIGIPASLPEVRDVRLELATAGLLRGWLPERPSDGHKGTFGSALIAAGSARFWGAPALAARGAYRAGAGLVGVAVPRAVLPTVVAHLPEATYPAVAGEAQLDEADARSLLAEMESYQALLVGPGLGEAGAFLAALLAGKRLPPLVVDADGLNWLAGTAGWPARLPAGAVLTPHPGEMARLMGLPLADLKSHDRVAVAQEQAAAWGHIVLLKGAYTVVAAPDGRSALIPFANPALATAGSGDVLAGAIAGLLAQGMPPYEAAVLGAYLHGVAGELAAATIGRAGLLAGDIADWLPAARDWVADAAGEW